MWIPRDLIMMGLGALILFVLVGGYEILFHYAELKEYEEEQEKKPNKKGWIKRGWHNMIRDIKSKKQDHKAKPKKKLTRKKAQAKLKKMFKD